MKVKPKENLNVRHPETGAIIKGECEIASSPQLKRLLKDGDLIEVKEQAKKPAAKKEAE